MIVKLNETVPERLPLKQGLKHIKGQGYAGY